jgi:hypothetical protein
MIYTSPAASRLAQSIAHADELLPEEVVKNGGGLAIQAIRESVEYPIADRLSFQCFLGLDLTREAPDDTAVWRFRERLWPERVKALFDELNAFS